MKDRHEQGLRTPCYDDMPRVPADLERFRAAFVELGTCRPQGFGPARIPWTAINEYAMRYRIADFDEFVTLIRAMDDAFMKTAEQLKAATANG